MVTWHKNALLFLALIAIAGIFFAQASARSVAICRQTLDPALNSDYQTCPTDQTSIVTGGAVCGNGTLDAGEQCDDGGLCTGNNSTPCTSNSDCSVAGGTCAPRSGDGCSATCQDEPPVGGNCPNTWEKTYGGTGIEGIGAQVQAQDNGFIALGTTDTFGAGESDAWLVKTDASGNTCDYLASSTPGNCEGTSNGMTTFAKTFGRTESEEPLGYTNMVFPTPDGGYVFATTIHSFGAGGDFWLVKTDVNGNTCNYSANGNCQGMIGSTSTFAKRFGGSSGEDVFHLLRLSDGFLLAGYTRSFGSGGYKGWAVKTDQSGNTCNYAGNGNCEETINGVPTFAKVFNGPLFEEFRAADQTSDGGFVLVGYTSSFTAGSVPWLVKTDSMGNTCDYLNAAVSGNCEGTSNGMATFSKTFADTGKPFFVEQTTDDGFVFSGDEGADQDFWLVKTDASGNTCSPSATACEQGSTFMKNFGGPDMEQAFSGRQTSDNGYILVGYTISFPDANGYDDIFVVKTDVNGNTCDYLNAAIPGNCQQGNHRFVRTFDSGKDDWAYSVVQTPDSGYLIGGFADSETPGLFDQGLLLKIDLLGNGPNDTCGFVPACPFLPNQPGGSPYKMKLVSGNRSASGQNLFFGVRANLVRLTPSEFKYDVIADVNLPINPANSYSMEFVFESDEADCDMDCAQANSDLNINISDLKDDSTPLVVVGNPKISFTIEDTGTNTSEKDLNSDYWNLVTESDNVDLNIHFNPCTVFGCGAGGELENIYDFNRIRLRFDVTCPGSGPVCDIDDVCEGGLGETCSNCLNDCGSCSGQCGNGTRLPSEQCEFGNPPDVTCPWSLSSDQCDQSSCQCIGGPGIPDCGDGSLYNGSDGIPNTGDAGEEECDDGDLDDYDGCSALCKIEEPYFGPIRILDVVLQPLVFEQGSFSTTFEAVVLAPEITARFEVSVYKLGDTFTNPVSPIPFVHSFSRSGRQTVQLHNNLSPFEFFKNAMNGLDPGSYFVRVESFRGVSTTRDDSFNAYFTVLQPNQSILVDEVPLPFALVLAFGVVFIISRSRISTSRKTA